MLKIKEKDVFVYIKNYIRENWSSPSIRTIQEALWYASPRSIQLLVNSLIEKWYLKKENGSIFFWEIQSIGQITVDVPLIWTVACGTPIFAEENIEAKIPVSTQVARSPHRYFFLRAKWDSMNQKNINDGDLILIREQHSASDWETVVALIDDEATIKEIKYFKDSIALVPHSNNPKHKPIILQEDFLIQWIFVRSFPSFIF